MKKNMIMVKKMGKRVNRYCVNCGSRMVYYARLSNPKAPNEHRIMVYGCERCTKDFEKPVLISIRTSNVEDPLLSMEIEVMRVREE